MATGALPFRGDTSAASFNSLLNQDPISALRLNPDLPPDMERIIQKALEKDRDVRYQSAAELRADLKRLKRDTSSGKVAAAAPVFPRAFGKSRWVWIAAVIVGIVVLATLFSLLRPGPKVQNPLSNAEFARLTDFEGAKTNPAISPDGKFVAFISDRSGTFDIWLIQANGGSLANLTQGRIADVRGPLRAVGFSGDGSEVWIAGIEGRRLRLLPLVGGTPHNFLDERAAEVTWSPDGTRLVYHTWEPGDPTFVADHNGANERQIVKNEPGLHNHYQIWSKDGRWIYFVRGRPATREMGLWRISPDGGKPEQLTRANTDIAYPTPIDERTILFVAHNENGAGPWLWAFDVETRTSRRVSLGLEQYTALAATADGRRLAASVVNAQVNLWSVPITSRIIEEQDVAAFPLPTVRAQTPRFGGGSLFYLSSRDGADGLWSYRDGQALEIWKGSEGALQSPPAVSADGSRVAFALTRNGKRQLHVIGADGTRLHPLSGDVDVRGTASWSPDGEWIVVAGSDRDGAGLFKLPSAGGSPVRIATGPFLDPVWSPRGDLIVYGGTQVFTLMPLLGVHPDGTPAKLAEINVRRDGERARFLPDGTGLVYMLGSSPGGQDFWLLDLGTMRSRQLTRLSNPAAAMRTFDISPDGSRIVFDRLRENSEILLIDLATKQAS
jgi:Tol biopolymer transport system component